MTKEEIELEEVRVDCNEFFPEFRNGFEVEAVHGTTRTTFRLELGDGERVIAELVRVQQDRDDRHDLMRTWVRKGYMREFLPNWWAVSTYYYTKDADGREICLGLFNPQDIDQKIDFDWVLPASHVNRERILHEIQRRAYAHLLRA